MAPPKLAALLCRNRLPEIEAVAEGSTHTAPAWTLLRLLKKWAPFSVSRPPPTTSMEPPQEALFPLTRVRLVRVRAAPACTVKCDPAPPASRITLLPPSMDRFELMD